MRRGQKKTESSIRKNENTRVVKYSIINKK